MAYQYGGVKWRINENRHEKRKRRNQLNGSYQ